MDKHRNKIIAATVIFCVLAMMWAWGGGFANRNAEAPPAFAASQDAAISPEDTGRSDAEAAPAAAGSDTADTEESATDAEALGDAAPDTAPPETPPATEIVTAPNAEDASSPLPETPPAPVTNPETDKDKYLTDPVPQGKPLPVEPQDAKIEETAHTVTLSVRCDTIRDNLTWLDAEKHELVPADGVIFPATVVTFYEGESVFNVLQREMKRAKIHMEFVNTPIYNSAYIEGINNLYEFDIGELSGWMYKVNDWFPNYGCSRYSLKDGDVVEWLYTCDLGRDIGGFNAIGGGWPAR
jgi:hypothetical protein